MTLVRRYLVLIALMFWQGGFTFYSAVVVPIGQDLFGRKQGFLTREVTFWMNVSGAIALLVLAWDTAAVRDLASRRSLRWWCLLVMIVGLGALVWLRPQMDQYLDVEELRIVDRSSFRFAHRWYLWISTGQWGAGLVYILCMLLAWRYEDCLAVSAAQAETPDHSNSGQGLQP
jgi:hypothetical protein